MTFPQPVNVLAEIEVGAYAVQVFNFKDTWRLEPPPPDNWDELVYRVLRDGMQVPEERIPPSAARAGAALVARMKLPRLF